MRVLKLVAVALALMLALSACTKYDIHLAHKIHGHGEVSHHVKGAPRAHTWAGHEADARWWTAVLAAHRARTIPFEANWDRVAACESGGRWSLNTGNGYYGGLQFSLGTWRAYGGTGYPHQKSRNDQIRIAEKVRTQSGLGHWPHCRSRW